MDHPVFLLGSSPHAALVMPETAPGLFLMLTSSPLRTHTTGVTVKKVQEGCDSQAALHSPNCRVGNTRRLSPENSKSR